MKRYSQKIKLGFIFVASMFLLNSCADEYLDNSKIYAIDTESFFNSETDYYKVQEETSSTAV